MVLDNFKERLKGIKAFVFDVDGVISQLMYIDTNGDLTRTINTKDGFAIWYALNEHSFYIAIITGGNSESVKTRFNAMGISDVYLKSTDKTDDFEDFIYKYGIKPEEVLYMGDDIPDYDVMKRVGLPVCPADAAEEIKSISAYISDKKGGDGCVRDVIEQVLRAQGKWFNFSTQS
jgi:3-deoxy-D-manno-octulosonate 8-phosphate phosphatase (KDO 8-P phosphatase)